MKFLVIGLGSMGKRRIRCLQALGQNNISGYDSRDDRKAEAEEKYGIRTFSDVTRAFDVTSPDALIISVPPDVHHIYMKAAIERRIHFFVEASVVDTDMEFIEKELKNAGIVAAPSATLLFHPAIRKIAEILDTGLLGKVSNVIFHSGQYLPDWHTYEDVSDFYVSNPKTGGGREIVPFELTWITRLFGFPKRVCGTHRKTITIKGAEEIDDTYNMVLDYDHYFATITVDVVSRYATRRLLINADKKQLRWSWDEHCIKIFDPDTQQWDTVPYEMKSAEAGYNPNIGENMYIDETRNFIDAVRGQKKFINDMENDHNVLKILFAVERSDDESRFVSVFS